MSRTTIDIDDPILQELKQIQEQEGCSLGRLVSDLLAKALARRRDEPTVAEEPPRWISRPMGARVDLTDKDALHRAMDEEESRGRDPVAGEGERDR